MTSKFKVAGGEGALGRFNSPYSILYPITKGPVFRDIPPDPGFGGKRFF